MNNTNLKMLIENTVQQVISEIMLPQAIINILKNGVINDKHSNIPKKIIDVEYKNKIFVIKTNKTVYVIPEKEIFNLVKRGESEFYEFNLTELQEIKMDKHQKLKKIIEIMVKKELKNIKEGRDELGFMPGDSAFIMGIARKEGIKDFKTEDEFFDFYYKYIKNKYNVTKLLNSDVKFIMKNYKNFLKYVDDQEKSNKFMRGTMKNDMGMDDDEIEDQMGF